eukprot:Nitzschia sp. Nitz4//scaffold14_size191712//177230//178405//NITZ4_001754-RA/size191712-processed-gene-0.292-mRNA-1//1//CDS//3329537020//679//frame0
MATPVNTETKEGSKEEWEIQRDFHKQQADQAFRMGGFRTAIDHYSKAIELDPDFILAYSNRSAAYLKNSEKSKALKDAEKVVALDPQLPKGHSRLAAALHSLKRFEQALDSYKRTLELEPNNAAAKKGVEDCQAELDRTHNEQAQQEAAKAPSEETATEKEAQEPAEEEDDLLNDFFADVEEATTKKKEEPKATNVIKNDRVTLGTGAEQMDRLLQSNYEWRNLNPYYVLQLPHTATEEEVARRYKALSLLLHPDKNGGSDRAQLAFDIVKKAKSILDDADRAKHTQLLVEEGLKQADIVFKQSKGTGSKSLQELQETEVMRIFAQVEQKRREVEERERKFEQRTQQQEDDQEEKERQERQFDKAWRKEERVDKRVGNWRDFAGGKKRKKS